jgi:DNA-binding protein YbaB
MKGMPPMGGNMNNLLKQAQKLQKQMEDMKEEIEKRTVEASSGGGAVTAIVTGKKEIVDIK